MSKSSAFSQKQQEQAAREIAEHKLTGTGYVLAHGNAQRYLEGWRFPVRKIDEPELLGNEPEFVTILIRSDEIENN